MPSIPMERPAPATLTFMACMLFGMAGTAEGSSFKSGLHGGEC